MADEQDNPGAWVPPPLTYLLTLLLGLVLDRRLHLPFLPHRVARVLGWPLVGGGMALATWFIRTMRAADTTLDVNKPVSSLVQHGPFRYSRNPGYLSLLMIYMGIAILRNALWVILLLPLLVVVTKRELIEREERYLERTFGEEYLAYKRRVRRWLQQLKFPRTPKRRSSQNSPSTHCAECVGQFVGHDALLGVDYPSRLHQHAPAMPTPLEEGEKTLEAINNVSAQKVTILIASGSRMGAACARELA